MKIFILIFAFSSFSLFANVNVILKTNKGNITIELDDVNAPISTANFLKYVDEEFYNGTIFHRVVKNFVIQGGGVTSDMTEKPTRDPIKNECTNGLSNLTGTIGMARNEDFDSATAQFYINTNDNVRLDLRYAVFGKVIGGMDIVRAIENSAVTTIGEYENVPVDEIKISEVVRLP